MLHLHLDFKAGLLDCLHLFSWSLWVFLCSSQGLLSNESSLENLNYQWTFFMVSNLSLYSLSKIILPWPQLRPGESPVLQNLILGSNLRSTRMRAWLWPSPLCLFLGGFLRTNKPRNSKSRVPDFESPAHPASRQGAPLCKALQASTRLSCV